MLDDISKIEVEKLENNLFRNKNVEVSIIRLDKIHPVLSGNKLFKLYYFLDECQKSTHKTILTFGGAYSNHLVAAAYACKELGLKSIGIVRGEKPKLLSHTLDTCMDYNMQMKFISRSDYQQKESLDFIQSLLSEFGEFTIIPEGGYDPIGAKGASLIAQSVNNNEYTHLCCAIGTATTVAGLLLGSSSEQQVIGVSVLKNMNDIHERMSFLTKGNSNLEQLIILSDYHFGGYAKHTPKLISFMNELYEKYSLATDFVYTAKMLFAVFDMIKKDQLPRGSKIACLHTGGLQGNQSLPSNTLIFS